MDRGDPFTTPPTLSNIPEKHPSVLKLAEQSDSEHKTFANGGGAEEGGGRTRVEEPVKATQMTSKKIMMLLS